MLAKIKAGALQFTMYIIVVIALLLAGFISLIKTHTTFKTHTQLGVAAINSATDAIYETLDLPFDTTDTIVLNNFSLDYKTLKIQRNYWGIFEKVIASSKIKHKTFRKAALVGGLEKDEKRTALYLTDNNRPLVVVGNTNIQGTAYLPKQGVRTGNISGNSYYGKKLIYGDEKQSSTELPDLVTSLETQLQNVYSKKLIENTNFIDIPRNHKLTNSFFSPIEVIYNSGTIRLDNTILKGHVIIKSLTKIIVPASSSLKDVILIAPSIVIESHFKGTLQAFASSEIKLGKNCTLDYPSALVLKEEKPLSDSNHQNEETKNKPSVIIESGVKFKGVIIYKGEIHNYKSQLYISKNSEIEGEVFCDKNLELLGKIIGSVYTSGFVANQSGSVYQNHIYNGNINANALANVYAGILFNDTQKGIAKWLY